MSSTATAPAPAARAAASQTAAQPSLQTRVDAMVQQLRANPNHPALIDAMQKLLAETNRSPGLLRLLFEWYMLDNLEPITKGKVLVVILNNLRNDAELTDRLDFGLDPSSAAFKAIYRGFKYHLDNAFESISLVSCLQNGHYTLNNAPKFIVAIPKSGSSLLGMCLGNMVRLVKEGKLGENLFEWRGYAAWWEQGSVRDWDLRPEIGMDPLFLRYPGGVYKGHIPPTDKNFNVLRLYQESRYVIIVREPRDQLAAHFCHHLRPTAGKREPMTADEVHAGLGKMIQDGSLMESLQFVGKWLTKRHAERSIVITYEQLMSDPLEALRRMAALYELDLTNAQIEDVYQHCTPVTNRETGSDRSGYDRTVYPLGWTGHVNIHERYFSAENLAEFDRVFRGFCTACPWGRAIQELYPHLTDNARS